MKNYIFYLSFFKYVTNLHLFILFRYNTKKYEIGNIHEIAINWCWKYGWSYASRFE
jgi:hypothetical protein